MTPAAIIRRSASLWASVQESAESRFYSEADWQRLRLELFYANRAMRSRRPISGNTWAVIQRGLNALLISPAEKRRVAIEVKAVGPDPDEDTAVSMVAKYQRSLRPV